MSAALKVKTRRASHLSLVWGDIPDWAYSATKSILESLKAVDPMTYQHCLRVGESARKLAKFAGLNEYQQKMFEFSGLLHDVGKMGVDQAIIHKQGPLNDEEFKSMTDHSVIGEQIVSPLAHHEFFRAMLPIVRGHHERIDGKGYPDKICGEEIPLGSRLILVVDTLDAMTHARAYRGALPIEKVFDELKKFSGTQFDSALVNIFLESYQHWPLEQKDPETLAKIG